MRAVLTSLDTSLKVIRGVATEMGNRVLVGDAAVRQRDDAVRCACTVILSGYLEAFIKDCVRSFIREVCSRGIPYADLPDKTRRQHFVGGGCLVREKAISSERCPWVTADHNDLVARLASIRDPRRYQLVWEAYADTRGNPGPEVIEELLRSLGVGDVVPTLGMAMGGVYGTKKLALVSFMAVRNECAHTGEATQTPTPRDIETYCDLVHDLALGIVTVLESCLAKPPYGLDLNAADVAALCRVPGISRARATAIVNHRSTYGKFAQISDVGKVPGIGSAVSHTIGQHAHV